MAYIRQTISALLLVSTVNCQMSDDMDSLLKHLFNETRYNKYVRPTFNQSTPTQVNISQEIHSLEELNLSQGFLVSINTLIIMWYDEFLTWKRSDFGGISQISLPRDLYWKPEIVMLSGSTNDDTSIGTTFSPALLTNDGLIRKYPAGYLKTKCLMDTSYFPMDTHRCYFQFICSNYESSEVVLNSPYPIIEMSNYQENNEWTLEKTEAISTSIGDTLTSVSFSMIVNSVTVRRRPTFELIHTFVPLILLIILCLVTCLVPVDSGERLSFAMTVFLSFVFMSSVAIEDLPRNSVKISMCSILMLVGSFTTTFGVLWSVSIVNIANKSHKNEQERIPKLLLKIFTPRKSKEQLCKQKQNQVSVLNEVENNDGNMPMHGNEIISEDHENNMSWDDIAKSMDKLYFKCLFVLAIMLLVVGLSILVDKKIL